MEASGDSVSDAASLSAAAAAYDSDDAESSTEGGGGGRAGERRRCQALSWWQAEWVAAEYGAAVEAVRGKAPDGSEPASTMTVSAEPLRPPAASSEEESNRRFWEACLANRYP